MYANMTRLAPNLRSKGLEIHSAGAGPHSVPTNLVAPLRPEQLTILER